MTAHTPTDAQTIRRARAEIKTMRIELRKIDETIGPGSDEAWNKLEEISEFTSALARRQFSILEGLLDLRTEFPNH